MTVTLGVMLLMLMAAVTMFSQVKHDVRLSRIESDVTQVEKMVVAEFTKAAAKAEAAALQGKIWPNDFGAEPDRANQGDAPCTPTKSWVPGRTYPVYCAQVLNRQLITGNYYQVQMRVRYQTSPDAAAKTVYGWIVTLRYAGTPAGVEARFWRLFFQHDWCTKQWVGTQPSCLQDQ